MSGSGAGGNQPSRTVRRPRTFTDGQGNVRRVRATRTTSTRRAAPKVDPIKQIVDDIIAGMNQPLDEQGRKLREQTEGTINQTNRLHDFYDGQVGAIRDDATQDFGTMLARAAELKGISANTVAQWQEFAKSQAGPSGGGTGEAQMADAAGHTQSDLAAANDSIARDLQAEGQSLGDVMAQLQASGRAAQREVNQQSALARDAGMREIDAAKAANNAQRAQLYRQIQSEERDAALKQQVAEAEWGLKNAQFQSLDNYRQGQLGLQAARLEQQSAPRQEERGRYGNLPKRWDPVIDKIYAGLQKQAQSENGIQRPWTQAYEQMTDHGLAPFAAARLAANWYGDRVADKSNPRSFMQLLGALNAGQKRNILDSIWGPGTYGRLNQQNSVIDRVTQTLR